MTARQFRHVLVRFHHLELDQGFLMRELNVTSGEVEEKVEMSASGCFNLSFCHSRRDRLWPDVDAFRCLSIQAP